MDNEKKENELNGAEAESKEAKAEAQVLYADCP